MRRMGVLLLAAVLALGGCRVSALDAEGWIVPQYREPLAFTDTAGTISQEAAEVCYAAGIMSGTDTKHFMPEVGLSKAQVIVISARLHRLLTTGSLGEFDSYRLPRDQWWHPYDAYLLEQIPELRDSEDYASMKEWADTSCGRERFFRMLGLVLDSAGIELPVINDVGAVMDCEDPEIIRFYQAGILAGKDRHGTLDGMGPLSRGAAAAMLARIIDPARRLTLNLEPMDLCRLLLDREPETVLMTVCGKDVTAEQFIENYAWFLYIYNHDHYVGMFDPHWVGEDAVSYTAQMVYAETLAEELGISYPASGRTYHDGYRGITAAGQRWYDQHQELLEAVLDALDVEYLSDTPEARFTGAWDAGAFQDREYLMYDIPVWGGVI